MSPKPVFTVTYVPTCHNCGEQGQHQEICMCLDSKPEPIPLPKGWIATSRRISIGKDPLRDSRMDVLCPDCHGTSLLESHQALKDKHRYLQKRYEALHEINKESLSHLVGRLLMYMDTFEILDKAGITPGQDVWGTVQQIKKLLGMQQSSP